MMLSLRLMLREEPPSAPPKNIVASGPYQPEHHGPMAAAPWTTAQWSPEGYVLRYGFMYGFRNVEFV